MKNHNNPRPVSKPSKTNNVHVGNSPAVSPAYAHNNTVAQKAINKALNVKPRRSK